MVETSVSLHDSSYDLVYRFIEAYENEGVEIWGITAQNEPSAGQIENFPFQCMGFTEEQQRDFIKFDLVCFLVAELHCSNCKLSFEI